LLILQIAHATSRSEQIPNTNKNASKISTEVLLHDCHGAFGAGVGEQKLEVLYGLEDAGRFRELGDRLHGEVDPPAVRPGDRPRACVDERADCRSRDEILCRL
jgi:hypothetical protein